MSNWLLVKRGKRHAEVIRLSPQPYRAAVQYQEYKDKTKDDMTVALKLVLAVKREDLRTLHREWFSSYIA